jgi:hypothetical protein
MVRNIIRPGHMEELRVDGRTILRKISEKHEVNL